MQNGMVPIPAMHKTITSALGYFHLQIVKSFALAKKILKQFLIILVTVPSLAVITMALIYIYMTGLINIVVVLLFAIPTRIRIINVGQGLTIRTFMEILTIQASKQLNTKYIRLFLIKSSKIT